MKGAQMLLVELSVFPYESNNSMIDIEQSHASFELSVGLVKVYVKVRLKLYRFS